jgi:2'-5' RNA ligase
MMSETPPRTRSKPGERRKFSKDRPPDPYGVEMPWRLFLALPLPPEVVERVDKITARLAQKEWPVRWTAAGSAHITLQFLGEVEASQAQMLRMSLPPEVAKHEATSLTTGRLGVFPTERKPRVLWMGLDGEIEGLRGLQRDLTRLLVSLGFQIDLRPFAPHVTLGRLREEISNARGMEIWTTLRGFELGAPIEVPVNEVVLYRSVIDRGGSRHEPLVRCPLNASAEFKVQSTE